MISGAQLERLLIAAHSQGVSKMEFDDGRLSSVEFFSSGSIVTLQANQPQLSITPFNTTTPVSDPIEAAMSAASAVEMPSDEDFRFFHSPIVEAENPIPQEQQRNSDHPF